MTASIEIDRWWAQGEHVPIELGGATRSIFVWRAGDGPSMTLLHGFPSSSHDWAKVAPALAERHALLLLDFLGFGASEKPAGHAYSLQEQADLVEAVWERDAGAAARSSIGRRSAIGRRLTPPSRARRPRSPAVRRRALELVELA